MAESVSTGELIITPQNESGGSAERQSRVSLRMMLSMMGVLLNDIDENIFFPEMKLFMLNRGVDRYCALVNKKLLKEIHQESPEIAIDDSGYDIDLLDPVIMAGDEYIDYVKVKDGLYCIRISHDEYVELTNRGAIFDDEEPVYFIKGDRLYVSPTGTVTIGYWHTPRQAALGDIEANDVNIEFDDTKKDIIVGLAFEEHRSRSQIVNDKYTAALAWIEKKNASVKDSESHEKNLTYFRSVSSRYAGFGTRSILPL